jgi:group I intron endonuclease
MVICGIYKIISPTGKVYVGQSKDIKTRWKSYRGKRAGIKKQIKLYNSLQKYGHEAHIFEIIEECPAENLNYRERHWQDFYNVIGKKGLNCILQKTEKHGHVSSLTKEVYDMFYGITYSGVNEAMRVLNDTRLKGKLNGAIYNNTNLVYKEDFDNNVFREKRKSKKYVSVIDIVTFVVFSNMDLAAEIYNIPTATLKNYLIGEYENPTNLRIHEAPNKITKVSISKKVIDEATGIIYESISEAAIKIGINRCSLGAYLSGRTQNKTSLKYYEEK